MDGNPLIPPPPPESDRVRMEPTAVRSPGLALYEYDESGVLRPIYGNRACRWLLGLPLDEPLPGTIEAIGLTPEDVRAYRAALLRAAEALEPFTAVQTLVRTTPSGRPVRRGIAVTPVRHGEDDTMRWVEWSFPLTTDTNAASVPFLEEMARDHGHSRRVWSLDLDTRQLVLYDPRHRAVGRSEPTFYFPDDLLTERRVHPDSVKRFRVFSRKMLAGQKAGREAFLLRSAAGTGYAWYTVSFETFCGTDGLPHTVFGMTEVIAESNRPARPGEFEHFWSDLLPAIVCCGSADLTADRVLSLWLTGRNLPTAQRLSYTAALRYGTGLLFSPSSRLRLLSRLEKEALIARSPDAIPTWASFSLELVEDETTVRPALLTVMLKRNAAGHVLGYFFLQHADPVDKEEICLQVPLHARDSEGLCLHTEALSLLPRYLSHTKKEAAHALIYPVNGERAIDGRTFRRLAAAAGLFFAPAGLVSVSHEGMLSVFLPNCYAAPAARARLEEGFAFLRKTLSPEESRALRFVATLTQGALSPLYIEAYLREAALICTRLERCPSDTIEFLPPLTDHLLSRTAELPSGNSEPMAALAVPAPLPVETPAIEPDLLTEREERLLLVCLDLIIRTESPHACLNTLLSRIGLYYGADRVYTIRLIPGTNEVEETAEWTNNRQSRLRGLFSGLSLDRFPLLRRVLQSKKPIFLTDVRRSTEHYCANGTRARTWSFAAVPCMAGENDFQGLLCIDHPTLHLKRLALPEALAPYLVLLQKKILAARYDTVSIAELAPGIVRNISSCRQALDRLTSERFCSLGAFVMSVPRLLSLENSYGFEHVSELLRYLAQILQQGFGNSTLIHLYDQEFVVLTPNITKEAFFERVEWTRQRCASRYPNQVVHGATWSRGVFNGDDLMKEARTIMLSQEPLAAARNERRITGHLPQRTKIARAATGAPRDFTVYFQPKIDLHTGKIAGAEALVRGLDEHGNLVSPANFIPAMERDGHLRDLDLFVFARVLWHLQQWKAAGRRIVPISFNFSRFTMFDHSTVGAVLAVLSHYDSVDPSLVEIEITETACGVEEETLQHTMEPYRAMGLRFALDDFGTGYANLSLFAKVHFDTIKLDRSLIQDLSVNTVGRSLLESIVRISREQTVDVVAEGAETEDQVDILRQQGCRFAQGFFYEKPLDAETFAARYLTLEN